MVIVTLDYYKKGIFEFMVEENTGGSVSGRFIDWRKNKKRFRAIDKLIETEDDWYLDDNGYRLEFEELFQASPWSITGNDSLKKILMRFMDYETGEARFSMEPWVRIGGEFFQPN